MESESRAASRPATVLAATMLVTSAVAGVTHGVFSLYWAAGGDWLSATLGTQIVAAFADRRWVLFPVGVLKIAFALLPLTWVVKSLPAPRLRRLVCWLGALVLVFWGGANTITGNLVLAGVVHPAGGYDRPGMIGHAWLWDPLFLIWGSALTIGLLSTRRHSGAVAMADHPKTF